MTLRLVLSALAGFTPAIFTLPALGFGNPSNPMTNMLKIKGSCIDAVKIFGRHFKKPTCKPLINTRYKDNRTGFYFMTDNTILTFSGAAPQVKTSADSVIQPIDLILFNDYEKGDPNNPNKLRAAGACKFANPYQGISITIECDAETSQGRFAGKFRTDGSKPITLMERGKLLTP